VFRISILTFFVFLFSVLVGCGPVQKRWRNGGNTHEAHIKLAEAAASVSHSLEQLAEIEVAVHPSAELPPPPNPARIGMERLASVDWTGPVEPLVRKIAKASHYKLRVVGRQRATETIVSITEKDTPLADILHNIAFQAQRRVRIKIRPGRRLIVLYQK